MLGYWESDFLGQIANPPNGGLAVTSNPYVFRMRLYWVDVRKDKFEFLAGQSWSLMTPNRKGISPLPGDIFFAQTIDVNYQLGLTWGRIPGFRFVYHPSEKVAFAVALENSEPYVGGGNGGSPVTLPAVISGTANAVSGAVLGGQINNGSSTISAAALFPDIIAKLAFDPTSRFHFEVDGVLIPNKIAFPVGTAPFPTFSKVGGGGSINLSFALTKNFKLITNNFYSSGGGRYIFGQAPDFIIRSNGSLSLVHSASTVTGFESTLGKTSHLRLLRRRVHQQEYGSRRERHHQDRLRHDRQRRPESSHPGNHVRHQYDLDERSQVGRPQPHVPILLSPTESVACRYRCAFQCARRHGLRQPPVHASRRSPDAGK